MISHQYVLAMSIEIDLMRTTGRLYLETIATIITKPGMEDKKCLYKFLFTSKFIIFYINLREYLCRLLNYLVTTVIIRFIFNRL